VDVLYAESVTHILLDVFAIPALVHDRANSLAQPQLWLDHAMALLEARPDCHLLLQLPRIGAPTAAAILALQEHLADNVIYFINTFAKMCELERASSTKRL
jgi:hypothetical protein